jgi:hypothetical protein
MRFSRWETTAWMLNVIAIERSPLLVFTNGVWWAARKRSIV